MRKIFAIIIGIITVVSAWSTIKMVIALANMDKNLNVSYAPLPIHLSNPSSAVISVSAIIYGIITIVLALITIKLSKTK